MKQPAATKLSDWASASFFSAISALITDGQVFVAAAVLDANDRAGVVLGCGCTPTDAVMRAAAALVDAVALAHVGQDRPEALFGPLEGHRTE